MIKSAGLAVSALTNKPVDPSTASSGDPVEDRKTAFKAHSTEYFTLAKRIKSAMESESGSLQDENLIPLKRPARIAAAGEEEITNGGLGSLDIGWLNSRGDVVGRRKEAEMWAEVRSMLERRDENASATDTSMTGQDTNGHRTD